MNTAHLLKQLTHRMALVAIICIITPFASALVPRLWLVGLPISEVRLILFCAGVILIIMGAVLKPCVEAAEKEYIKNEISRGLHDAKLVNSGLLFNPGFSGSKVDARYKYMLRTLSEPGYRFYLAGWSAMFGPDTWTFNERYRGEEAEQILKVIEEVGDRELALKRKLESMRTL
jgi:hypothetical protein